MFGYSFQRPKKDGKGKNTDEETAHKKKGPKNKVWFARTRLDIRTETLADKCRVGTFPHPRPSCEATSSFVESEIFYKLSRKRGVVEKKQNED